MLAPDKPNPTSYPGVDVDDGDDMGVPASERGKGGNMLWDKRHPSWVLGLIAGTFAVVMILAVLGMLAYLNF